MARSSTALTLDRPPLAAHTSCSSLGPFIADLVGVEAEDFEAFAARKRCGQCLVSTNAVVIEIVVVVVVSHSSTVNGKIHNIHT